MQRQIMIFLVSTSTPTSALTGSKKPLELGVITKTLVFLVENWLQTNIFCTRLV